MIFFPNCKINLGLNIVSKRPDGYHDLETVFYPIQIKDAIEVIENKEPGFSISGSLVEGEPKDNLCFKAHQLLKKDFPNLPAVQIHLHKMIPIGAGLGGGSSDAAFMLKLLNKKFGLSLSETQLQSYALQLGSDCPFFIVNKPCFATGRGEKLEHMDLDLGAYKFLIVYPGIHVNTSQAFYDIRPATPGRSVKEIVQQPIQSWKNELKNDFEGSVFNQYKEIKTIKEKMYEAGATYASMSGSGSVVYGIFKKDQNINSSFSADYFVRELDS